MALRAPVAGVAQVIGDFVQKSHLIPIALSAGQAIIGALGAGLRLLAGLFLLAAAPIAHLAQEFYQFVVSGGLARMAVDGVRTAIAFLSGVFATVRGVVGVLVGALVQMASALHLSQIGAALLHGTLSILHGIVLLVGATFLGIVHGITQASSALISFIASGRLASTFSSALRTSISAIGTAFSAIGTVVHAVVPYFQLLWQAAVNIAQGFAMGVGGVVMLAAHFGMIQRIGAMLWKTLQDLGNFLMGQLRAAWSSLSSALASVGSSVQQAWAAILQLINALKPLMPVLKLAAMALGAIVAVIIGAGLLTALGLLVGLVMAVARGLTFLIQGLSQMLAGIVQVVGGIVQVISGFWTIILGLFTGNGNEIKQGWSTLWSGVENIFAGIWRTIVGLFQTVFGTIWGVISGFVQGVIGFFNSLYDALVGHSIIPDLVNAIFSWFNRLVSQGEALIGNLVMGVLQWFLNLEMRAIAIIRLMISAAIFEFDHFYNQAITLVSQLVTQFVLNLINLKNQAGTQFHTMVSLLTGILQGFVSTCFNIGSNIVHAIGSGIQGALGWLGGVMQNLGGFIGRFLPHSPAEEGELSHLNEYGPALVRGFAQGILGSLGLMTPALSALTSSVHAAFSPQAMMLALQSSAMMGLGAQSVALGHPSSAMYTSGGQTGGGPLPGGLYQSDIAAIVAAVATEMAATGGGQGGGGQVLEVDGRQLARVMGPHLAKEKRLTLGVRNGQV